MAKKYDLPPFLSEVVTPTTYDRWLRRKARAHVTRDKKRGNSLATGEAYRRAIHDAVIRSEGLDEYTGEDLDWTLISKYDNDKSKRSGRKYKHSFALLPTVDHVGDGTGPVEFCVCSWRTNDAKSDLGLAQFLLVCRAALEHNGFTVVKRGTPGD